MSFITEIRKLEGRHFLVATLTFLGVVGPGYLTVYHYHQELMEKYDVIKLTIFAASLSVPVLFAATTIVVITSPKGSEPDQRQAMLFGALGSGPIQYFALLVAYQFNLSISGMYKCVAALLVVFAFVNTLAEQQDKKAANQSTDPKP